MSAPCNLNEDDDDYLDTSIWDLVENAVAIGNEFDSQFSREAEQSLREPTSFANSSFLDLSVVVEDLETGEEVELPPVRVVKSAKKNS